ncbi:NGFI-A-binding protein homolog isoform X1 [Drosophila pseudoobscura]|uniref:NGFI-A-binding protein homolog isoform X1 n=1 Tax=Drosophila pseudoobscura pseudoobscura TaxID=46245 RepID=A0A6I8W8X7_DROPS|nr:NGFI-A-binding protein homolog isoform X1 [Drosophila pseudoobscura]
MEANANSPSTPTTTSSTVVVSTPSPAASTSSKSQHSHSHSQPASSASLSLAPASTSTSASATPTTHVTQSQLLTTSLEAAKQEDLYNLSLASGLSEGQRSLSGAPSASSSPILSPQGKIFGRNANGTMITTSRPGNEAEVQLYRVLQRASLLAYYDTLLEMGGDDVQQLYDAGEEEFLEIMALVGMASKPLHVRRLQKALHEWANNPGLFQGVLMPQLGLCETPPKPALVFNPDTTPALPRQKFPSFNATGSFQASPAPVPAPGPVVTATATAPAVTTVPHLISQISCTSVPVLPSIVLPSTTPLTSNPNPQTHSNANPSSMTGSAACVSVSTAHQVSSSSPQLTPVLTEMQIQRITMCAEKIGRQLPQREPRAQTTRKRTTRELEQVIAMSEHDPRRMDEIRKYSAIYGRFDCKRRPEKPLTLHEVCVNEAAAQLCRNPQTIWLLTRRDELFPLARQIVKDAGFGHSASIARYGGLLTQLPGAHGAGGARGSGSGSGSGCVPSDVDCESSDASMPPKRQRLSSTEAAQLPMDLNREAVEDSRYNLFAMYQKFAKPPFDLTEIAKFSLGKTADFEDNDSRFSFSNSSSSPPMPVSMCWSAMRAVRPGGRPRVKNDLSRPSSPPQTACNGLEGERSPLSRQMDASSTPCESVDLSGTVSAPSTLSGVQVISAAGDNIIAVANPALALSPTLNEVLALKRNAAAAAASPEA